MASRSLRDPSAQPPGRRSPRWRADWPAAPQLHDAPSAVCGRDALRAASAARARSPRRRGRSGPPSPAHPSRPAPSVARRGAVSRARSLGVSLGHDPLLLGDGPVRLLDLVGEVEADLVDQLHHLVLVDHDLSRERDMARVLDQVLDTVQQLVDLYLNFSFNALATGGGTRSETLPP